MHERRHEGRMMQQRAGSRRKASIPVLKERNSRSKRRRRSQPASRDLAKSVRHRMG